MKPQPLLLAALLLSCGPVGQSVVPDGGTAADPNQTPPEGKDAIEAWIAGGAYKSWHCEPLSHAARSPSPHGWNRICSNDLTSAAGSSGDYPEGAASVKEIWSSGGGELTGYAVSRKIVAGTGGDGWYWYERIGTRLNADGRGDSPAAAFGCVGCHSAAGADSSHSGRDYVYTQVR